MKATVGERGQVTIPKKLRDRLGIKPGMVLEFELVGGKLEAVKKSELDPFDQVFGCLKGIQSTDEFIEDMRGAA